jgi:hypothetical protein
MSFADRPIHKDKSGGRDWTPVDPALKGALVCSTTPAPPLWAGKLALQVEQARTTFLDGLWARIARAVIVSALTVPAYLVLVREWSGLEDMMTEAAHQLAWLVAAVGCGVIAFGLDFGIALAANRKDGVWYGHKFVFNEPKNVFAVHVTSEDNGKAFPFAVPGALAGSFVQFEVVVDRTDKRVKADLNLGPGHIFDWASVGTVRKTGIKLSSKMPVYLMTNAAPEATASTVRVFVKWIRYDDKPDPKLGIDGWGQP